MVSLFGRWFRLGWVRCSLSLCLKNSILNIFFSFCSVIVERLYVIFLLMRFRKTLIPCKALVGNILYPVLAEYQFNPPLLSLAIALGFFAGALFWGLSSDIWGRRYVLHISPH